MLLLFYNVFGIFTIFQLSQRSLHYHNTFFRLFLSEVFLFSSIICGYFIWFVYLRRSASKRVRVSFETDNGRAIECGRTTLGGIWRIIVRPALVWSGLADCRWWCWWRRWWWWWRCWTVFGYCRYCVSLSLSPCLSLCVSLPCPFLNVFHTPFPALTLFECVLPSWVLSWKFVFLRPKKSLASQGKVFSLCVCVCACVPPQSDWVRVDLSHSLGVLCIK